MLPWLLMIGMAFLTIKPQWISEQKAAEHYEASLDSILQKQGQDIAIGNLSGILLKNFNAQPEPDGKWVGGFKYSKRGNHQEPFDHRRLAGIRVVSRKSSSLTQLSEANQIFLLYNSLTGELVELCEIKTDSADIIWGQPLSIWIQDMVFDWMNERENLSKSTFDITANTVNTFAQGLVYRINARWRNRVFTRYSKIYTSHQGEECWLADSLQLWRDSGIFAEAVTPENIPCEPGSEQGFFIYQNQEGLLLRVGPTQCRIPEKTMGCPGWIDGELALQALTPHERRCIQRIWPMIKNH